MTEPAKPLHGPSPAGAPIDNLIAIASGKGGVGKTWLSVTLADAFAREGRKVLLVDGDLGLANVDVQLGLTPTEDLASVLSGAADLDDGITPFAGGAGYGGFDVLAGRSGSGALAQLGRDELIALARTLKKLAPRYDRVLLDLGAGIEQPVRLLCTLAGQTLIVLNDEPTSLTDAYALIKVLAMAEAAGRIGVVVNAADDLPQGRRTHRALAQACKTFLGQEPPLIGIVRKDRLVKEAIRHQSPLLARYPQSQAGQDVVALVAVVGD